MERNRESFFTRLFGKNKRDQEKAEILVDEKTLPPTAQTLPHTLLVFTQVQQDNLSVADQKKLHARLMELPPLPLGEVNFAPFEAGHIYGGFYVKLFIRNGRDQLEEDFTLDALPLSLIDATGEKIATGFFNPREDFGSLKFGESRYWIFAWHKDQVLKANPDLSTFTIEFE